MSKTALITGITGQDGAYLAKHLLELNYKVFGACRRSSVCNKWRLEYLGVAQDVELIDFDLCEQSNIINTIKTTQPDEVYNLAAQSFVGTSFKQPIYTSEVDAIGVARMLEAIRLTNPSIKFYQASTSEMFGKVKATPQNENTPFHPRSPYGVAKLYAHWLTINYRESYGMHTCSGILFNHESPLRGLEFVTRKITSTLAKIKYGQADILELGNIDAKRDWGFAEDYVKGMHLMLNHHTADDFILSTGQTHSVREFINTAAAIAGFDLEWSGENINEKAVDRQTGKTIIQINEAFYRPAEVDLLLGDSKKARNILGWQSACSFEQLATLMMESDLKHCSKPMAALL
jgi:GDPmannose 4,6-dehydratase